MFKKMVMKLITVQKIDEAKLTKLRLRCETDDPLYPGMKKLKVRGKDLTSLPTELFHISELEVLDLSPERESCLYYRIMKVPSDIGKLINLRILMLDTNEFEEIPGEIGLLTGLEKMSLSNNRLENLPDGFGKLKNLVSLHMANNMFSHFPKSICDMESLVFLDMSDNQIPIIPDTISQLKNLETFIIFLNLVDKLPDTMCDMTELRTLWLGNNKIRALPKRIGNLKNLDWGVRHTFTLCFDGNPLESPPMAVCKKGIRAIDKYFAAATMRKA